MPPRGGRGQTDEQKQAALDAYKASDENTHCEFIFKERTQGKELKEMHPGTDDILDDWQPILTALHKLVEGFKVPQRRAKSYDQAIFRTMVFKRVQTDFIEIDQIKRDVPNSANQDHFDCKEKFMNIIRHIEVGYDGDYLEPGTLASWKKDMISKLKDFEKKYVKHAKTTNPILAKIHTEAMQPVVDLMEASKNLQNFTALNETKKFPEFRKLALTEKYIEHLTKICDILQLNPNKDGKTLDDPYDIRHILEILEIPNWKDCPPFEFYITPLKNAFDQLQKELLDMHTAGPLHVSYYVERNYEMTRKIIKLVQEYNTVAWLCGDELKRDQFKFIYEMHDKIYCSALKNFYLDPNNNGVIVQSVIPEINVFNTMLLVRDIDDRKQADAEKAAAKKAEREALGLSEEEEEELVLDIPQPVQKKGKKKVEIDPEVIEEARQKALYKRELEQYGRTWIWENYYKDDQDRKDFWLTGAAALRRINPQVLEDIEDFIMLKGFAVGGAQLSSRQISDLIQKDLDEKRAREKMELTVVAEKDEVIADPFESGKVEDQKRDFVTPLRPHKKIWNFVEDDEETKMPHVLRAQADPNLAYIDGRVADLLIVIEGMGTHMRMHNSEFWEHLNKQTMKIFRKREDKIVQRMEDFQKQLEEAAMK